MGQNTTLFDRLVNFHLDHNMAHAMRYISNGTLQLALSEAVPGDENGEQWYKGGVILANGEDLVDRLVTTEIVRPSHIGYYPCENEGDIERIFASKQTKKDGIFIFERNSGRVARVKIRESSLGGDYAAEGILPYDFLTEDGSVPLYDSEGSNIGNRAEIAVRITRRDGFDIDAYMIKHTIYNSIGLGPVIHIGREEMHLLAFVRSDKGPYIDERNQIAAQMKTYKLMNGTFVETSRVNYSVEDILQGNLVSGRSETPILR